MNTTIQNRVWNFSAGPAMLPLPVLLQIQKEILNYGSSGESVVEMSHRSKVFVDIFDDAIQRLRRLLDVPDEFEILFLQGGGRLQNIMIPMNFLTPENPIADFIVTGAWGNYSLKDAKKFGDIHIAFTDEDNNFRTLPSTSELQLNSHAAYVHLTSNETIHGVQFDSLPDTGKVPLVVDASSDFLSRPIDFSRVSLVYACAQKNAGIAGLAVVIARRDMIEKTQNNAPGYLSYAAHLKADGMYNTPPTFAIYVTGLVCRWVEETIGSINDMQQRNEKRAQLVYSALDRHKQFYSVHPIESARSRMNICFKTPTSVLDETFCQAAHSHQLSDLKGHRSVGGIRASIYNAMPEEGVKSLCQFIEEFATRNG